MSIAVSAVVRPSGLLFAMVAALCTGSVAIAIMLGIGWIGELPSRWQAVAALLSLGAAGYGAYVFLSGRKIFRIDISGRGQIRVTPYAAPPGYAEQDCHQSQSGMVLRLMPDSTLWPCLLLLRLRAENGVTTTLPILPDCVSRDNFRALSVACRWIAAHNNVSEPAISS